MRASVWLLFLGDLIAAAPAIRAQPASPGMVECLEAATGSQYKVLFDDISDADTGVASPLMQPLVYAVGTQLEKLELESHAESGEGSRLKVVPCPRRQPLGEGDFNRPRADWLNARNVLLEVWGRRIPVQDAPDSLYIVGYALIPVRFYEYDSGIGVYMVTRRTASRPSVEDFLSLLDHGGELTAYAAIALGTKFSNVREYERAMPYLCKGQLALESRATRPDFNQHSLLKYVRRQAAETVKKARAASGPGGLSLLPATQAAAPCTGGK